jgi:hypothetical protein
MCEDMLERSGLPSSAIGIKGSIARGLSIEGSDFDFGIYGLDNAICLVDAISRALSIPNSGWRRRWPPPEDSNLYALYTSSYSDLTLPEMWVGFEENGRDIFNFTFLDRDVSLYFHPDRFQRAHWPNVKGVELGEPETFTGTFGRQADLYHLDTPAFVQLSEVTTDKGEDLGEVTVSSWSRGFQYGTEGDRVRFVARKTNSPQVLVIPDFGVNWPIRILDL